MRPVSDKGPFSDLSIASVAVRHSDDLEFPYMLEVNVTSSCRSFGGSQYLPVGTYTFYIDGKYNLSSRYMVRGGEPIAEAECVVKHVAEALIHVKP